MTSRKNLDIHLFRCIFFTGSINLWSNTKALIQPNIIVLKLQ